MRAAELTEVLILGLAHQEMQKKFPIVAAGSVWSDHSNQHSKRTKETGAKNQAVNSQRCDRYMPFLWGLPNERTLNLNLLGTTFQEAINKEWQPFCRFAAVLVVSGQ